MMSRKGPPTLPKPRRGAAVRATVMKYIEDQKPEEPDDRLVEAAHVHSSRSRYRSLADVGHSPGGCDGGVADSSAVAASDESLTAQSGLTLFVVCRISASDMMFWSMWKATR